MRILKFKIARAQQRQEEMFLNMSAKTQPSISKETHEKDNFSEASWSPRDRVDCNTTASHSPSHSVISFRKNSSISQDHTSSNNIMKNYCRGITNFALSSMAVPYLLPLLQKRSVDLDTFRKFIKAKKSKINCIKQLRGMLLVTQNDEKQIAAMKRIFKEITIIFLKFFSPNWIYNSNIADKSAHLKYRFKILRRVKEPHYFTYLQGFDKEFNG